MKREELEPGRLLHKYITGAENLWCELDAEEREIWSKDEVNLFNEMTTNMRESFAKEMIAHGFSTGHGNTVEELHRELWNQIEQNPSRQPPAARKEP